jgi:hypothetical protein
MAARRHPRAAEAEEGRARGESAAAAAAAPAHHGTQAAVLAACPDHPRHVAQAPVTAAAVRQVAAIGLHQSVEAWAVRCRCHARLLPEGR